MDVRRDQEHPREQAEPDRQDQRVDQRRAVGARIAPSDEKHEPRHQDRIDRQVQRVADRRKPDVGAEQLRIAVRVEVAAEEEELPRREEPPRRPRPRLVHPDPDDDRDHARQPERVDQRAASGERRHEEVQPRQGAGRDQIPRPDAASPVREYAPRTSRDFPRVRAG